MTNESTTTTTEVSEPIVEVVEHAGSRTRPSTAPTNGKPLYADTATEEEKELIDDGELERKMDEESALWKAQTEIQELKQRLYETEQHKSGQMPTGVQEMMQLMSGAQTQQQQQQHHQLPQGGDATSQMLALMMQAQVAAGQPPNVTQAAAAVSALQGATPDAAGAAAMLGMGIEDPDVVAARERKMTLAQLDAVVSAGDPMAVAAAVLERVRDARRAIYLEPTPENIGDALETLMLVETALDTELWIRAHSSRDAGRALKTAEKRIAALRRAIRESFYDDE